MTGSCRLGHFERLAPGDAAPHLWRHVSDLVIAAGMFGIQGQLLATLQPETLSWGGQRVGASSLAFLCI